MIDPLHLKNENGESLSLWIADYQFPQVENELYDSNWLNIGIEVQLKQGSWTATDPCAVTMEIEQLIGWLIDIGAGKNTTDYFGFIEPCLSFKVSGALPCTLKISFWAELKPKWAEAKDKFWFEMPLDRDTLLQIIASFESQLENYPPR